MNIKEIARLAGVSSATVSRYLNKGYLSEEKRERIRRVIEETGYVPSSQAQTLRTKKTRLVGVILPKISSETVSQIVEGISSVLTGEEYHMLLANTGNRSETETEYLKIFNKNMVDGIILIATAFDKEKRRLIEQAEIPVVIVGQKYSGQCCIYHNDREAAREMTKLLLNAGRERIGYLGAPLWDRAAGKERREGFLLACRERKLKPEEHLMKECGFTMEDGYEQMKKLLEEQPDLNGVFCATGTIAVGAMECAREAGIKIPEQLAFAAIGDNKMARVVSPKLTTAHYYYRLSGVEAGKRVLDLIRGEREVVKEMRLGYEVIRRESV